MPSTSRKSSVGLLVLFVLALLLSLAILLFRKTATAATADHLQDPQRNLNPFALIQLIPDNWIGLVKPNGTVPKGFLAFDSALNGVRAGFISLWHRYFSKQLLTIAEIAPLYAPDAPEAWAAGVSKYSGIAIGQRMSWAAHAHTLGRAIERFENGSTWVSNADYKKGYDLATAYTHAR